MIIGIVCYPTFGGSGVLATELGIELSKRGYEIHFITCALLKKLVNTRKIVTIKPALPGTTFGSMTKLIDVTITNIAQ